MGSGPVWPEHAFTIWTPYGPIRFFYGDGSNWPAQPWLDTSVRQ